MGAEGTHMRTPSVVIRTLPALAAAVALAGCSAPEPEHSTPGWDDLVVGVQSALTSVAPEPVVTESAGDQTANLTTSSPNAVPMDLTLLVVGQCLLWPYDDAGDLKDVVQVVPCTEPHYGEVYATGLFTETDYSDTLADTVDNACKSDFAAYVGIDYWSSSLYYDYSYPSQAGWDAGSRGWRCYAYEGDDENAGSVRGSGR